MTDLLIVTALSSLAVTYVIEFLDLITFSIVGKASLNKYLSLPISFGAVFSQVHLHKGLIITVPATAFASVAISKFINKPVVISNGFRGRP
jgi:hypothetical protein